MKKRRIAMIILAIASACCLMISVMSVFASNTQKMVTFIPENNEFYQESVWVDNGAIVSIPEGIKRAGYKVTWYKGESVYDFNTPITTNIELKAKWVPDYTDERGNEIIYDKNGITTATVWYNGSVVSKPEGTWLDRDGKDYSYNGLNDPDTQYFVREEGSIFVLGEKAWVKENANANLQKVFFPGYTDIGGGFDVTKDILIKLRVDPLKGWSMDANGRGRFSLSFHMQEADLYNWGAAGYADPFSITLWGNFNPFVNGESYRLITSNIGAYTTTQIAYDDGEFVYIRVHIGEEVSESYITVNDQMLMDGYQIAQLGSQNGFQIGNFFCRRYYYSNTGAGKDGKVYLNLTSHDCPTQFQVTATSVESKVTFTSETAGFSRQKMDIEADATIALPSEQAIAGYDFLGYYQDKEMIIPFDQNAKFYEDTTIYAKYLPQSEERVTLTVQAENYPTYTVTLKKGAKLPDLSNVYKKEGFTAVWYRNGQKVNTDSYVTQNSTLSVKWEETELALDHYQFGVKDGTKFEYRVDENYWSDEYTNYELGDTYIDSNGNTIIPSTYGGQQHDDSFIPQDDFTRFLLPGIGQIMNLQKLDVSKRIVIKYALQNWDVYNDTNGFGISSITFSLYDNVLQGLKTPQPLFKGYESGAKLRIETSNLEYDKYDPSYSYNSDIIDLYGKFRIQKGALPAGEHGIITKDFGYEDEKEFIIEIYISEDGTENYLKINGELIENAIDGIKRSDFENGYAYLHISNYGCTNVYDALVSQDFHLEKGESENGTFVVDDMPSDGMFLFKDEITLTCTPAPGYMIKCAKIGDKEYLPDDATHVTIYKGYGNETVTVEFAKSCTMTFDSMGGSKVKKQTVLSGEKFFKPTNPKKKGFKFIGWYIDEACTVKYNFSLLAEDDITVYAKWSDGTESTYDEMQPWGCGVGCGSNLGTGLMALFAIPVATGALIIKSRKKKNRGE